MDANSYLELGLTGQNETAQDRVKPPNGAPHRSRRSLHQGVGHRRVLDLYGMAGPRNYVPQLHQSGHRHRLVAVRGGDGRHVAIQCKSRRLENGIPAAIQISELDSFANASSNPFWAERWLVANGEAPFSPQTKSIWLKTNPPSSRP